MGDGISELFTSMGATHIISGGQTMNPSTEDIVKVIEQSQCKRAIILPNNKNIRMSSDQAATLVEADTLLYLQHQFHKVLRHCSNTILHHHLKIITLI